MGVILAFNRFSIYPTEVAAAMIIESYQDRIFIRKKLWLQIFSSLFSFLRHSYQKHTNCGFPVLKKNRKSVQEDTYF